MREVNAMTKLEHNNCLKIFDYSLDGTRTEHKRGRLLKTTPEKFMVMELAENSELYYYLEVGKFSE